VWDKAPPLQSLRAWIDHYEEAVTNHYSPELRARIQSIRMNGVHSEVKPPLQLLSTTSGSTKCRITLLPNGTKVSGFPSQRDRLKRTGLTMFSFPDSGSLLRLEPEPAHHRTPGEVHALVQQQARGIDPQPGSAVARALYVLSQAPPERSA